MRELLSSCALELAAQDGDGFQVEGLGEEVDEVEGADLVEGLEGVEVAGQGGGVAGDVDERGCGDAR